MKASKFTEAQVASVLRQAEEGTAVGDVCRRPEAPFYNWRKALCGVDAVRGLASAAARGGERQVEADWGRSVVGRQCFRTCYQKTYGAPG